MSQGKTTGPSNCTTTTTATSTASTTTSTASTTKTAGCGKSTVHSTTATSV